VSYAQSVEAARRLTILLALYFAPGYTMARAALRAQVELTGYIVSADRLATDLAWLAEQGLVEPLEMDAVRLTERGADVALGKTQTPGVRRPGPDEITN
jgi:hypothetical protein